MSIVEIEPVDSGRELVSIVVPSYNEGANLPDLIREIVDVFKDSKWEYEVIIADDGSTDDTWQRVISLHSLNDKVGGVRLRINSGKAAALDAGFNRVKGDYVVTIDADMQDDPAEIPAMLLRLEEEADLVNGWKQNRLDKGIKNKTSKLFNTVVNQVSVVTLNDHNCGLKAYRREVVNELNLHGHQHRFIPVFVSASGFRVVEHPVRHRQRGHGKTKYGPMRFVHGSLDLSTVILKTQFQDRPMHFFGPTAIISSGIAVACATTAVAKQSRGDRGGMWFAAAMSAANIAATCMAGGLLSELIVAGPHPANVGEELSPRATLSETDGGVMK